MAFRTRWSWTQVAIPLLLLTSGLQAQAPRAPGGAAAAALPGPNPPSGAGPGRPGVLVAPTRVVLDNRHRNAEVNLTNTGNARGEYRVSLVRMDMDADGGLKEVPSTRVPGQVAPEDLVRYAPKVVGLDPQESQAVRIQVRKPAGLPAGEYRVYMVFREQPPPPEEPSAPDPEHPPKAIQIKLTTLFGIAIPVIIRQGETSAQVTIAGLALAPDRRQLRLRLERTGNQSVYGDLKATFEPKAGKPSLLGAANGLSVFTPNAIRNLTLALDAAVPAEEGQILVTFTAPVDQGGQTLAVGSLAIH